MFNKKLIYGISVLLFVFSLYGSYAYFSNSISLFDGSTQTKPASVVTNAAGEEVSNEPKTEECPLNGELLTKAHRQIWEKRRPMGVMIENHTESRPQSGISSADIVYETVAEGGITRFLTVFYCHDAKFIGPVRSARIYFIRFLEEYGLYPLYAHVGGANTDGPADALGEIDALGWANYNDLNQFSVPFPIFWRDYDRLPNRATEHTVYSATQKLWDYAASKRGLTNVDKKDKAWDKGFTKWKFKDDGKTVDRGQDGQKISFGFWNSFATDYAVVWTYNQQSNSYKRENGGVLHVDKNTNKPVEAKNIVVMFAKESPAYDGYPGGHILYKTIGTGEGILFQNGQAKIINWSKKDENSRTIFTDENSAQISFVRGKIFVELLPIGNKVTY